MEKHFIGIIPARYASTRFPGKPLALLGDKPVVQHVYERARKVLDEVYVATDNSEIFDVVTSFGGRAIMTSTEHKTGTDRIKEAFVKSGSTADIIVNIQGDEPFIDPSQIELLKTSFDNPQTDIATLAKPFDPARGFEALFNPNLVKVVFSDSGYALYFSRSIIPYVRDVEWKKWLETYTFHTHIGIYAYTAETLCRITELERSSLETAENLEQLRWLQAGYNIHVSVTETETIGIDTPEDLERAQELINTIR